HEEQGASLESLQIRRPWAGVYVARQEGRADSSAEDSVLVGLGDRRMPRMKGTSYCPRFGDAYRRGKGPVERAMQVLWRNGSAQCEACHLSQCVDPGIGAP